MRVFILGALCALLAPAPLALAHHGSGPATAGLPSAVMNAETIGKGRLQISWSSDFSQNELISKEDLESRVRAGKAAMQTVDYVLLQSLNLGFGLGERLMAEVQMGTSRAENFREGHLHGDG